MPMRAPIVCRCGVLNCQLHTAKIAAHERDIWRKLKENNPFVSFYKTARWQAMRRRLLSLTPVCQECNSALATDIDHIVPAREWIASGHDFFDESNLSPKCHACHASKTASELAKQ